MKTHVYIREPSGAFTELTPRLAAETLHTFWEEYRLQERNPPCSTSSEPTGSNENPAAQQTHSKPSSTFTPNTAAHSGKDTSASSPNSKRTSPMTAETPDETLDRLGHELAETLHKIGLLCSPLFDAADGVKAELERRGWSPGASEDLASEYLALCLRRLFVDLTSQT
ncbi:hypothetical protein ABZ517_16615 [Streptomyces scabiei]|uniref:hypothetical protein n=1 Tax=Streptomyces scabiei TaxID=1930 RepID=UPI0033C4F4B0